MAKAISHISADGPYVCCECNQAFPRSKGADRPGHAESRCHHCGHELIATRPIGTASALGVGWACLILLGIAVLSKTVPDSRNTIITVGLAICGALACNRLFEATRYRGRPEPSASIFRQTLAEAIGAFLVLLIGSAILLR
jgi:DNA-directed RNA polymerase subunit RPC12/RpoP